MALEQDILLAVKPEKGQLLKLVNVNKERFPDHQCPIDNVV